MTLPLLEPALPRAADPTQAAATAAVARARAECLQLGVAPDALARLLLDEAVLALLIDGHDETGIRAMLDDVVATTAVPWLGRLRQKSGMCDCVAEVHFEAQCEANLARGK